MSAATEPEIYWSIPFTSIRMKRTIAAVLLLSSLYHICFFLDMLLFPYIVKELNINNIYFGYLITIESVTVLICGPIFGQLCDAVGIKKCLIAVQIEIAVSTAIVCFSNNIWLLLLSRLCCVLRHGQQVYQTILSSVAQGPERTTAFSHLNVCFSIGLIGGSAIGGVLGQFLGSRLPLLLPSLVSMLLLWISHTYIHVDKPTEHAKKPGGVDIKGFLEVLKRPGVGSLFIERSLAMGAFYLLLFVMPILLLDILHATPAQTATVRVAFGINMFVSSAFGVASVQRYFPQPKMLFRIGAICLALGYFGLMMVSRLWHLYVFIATIPLGMALANVATDTQITSIVPAERHGTALGLSFALIALSRALGPIVGGFLMESFGMVAVGLFGIAGAAIALALTYNTGRVKID